MFQLPMINGFTAIKNGFKNYANFKRYNKNPPYKIYFKKKLSNSSVGEYVFSEGVEDDYELLSQFRINSDNDYIDNMLEQLLEGDNQWYCNKCKKEKMSFKKKQIYKPPYYLIIQLQRFKNKGNRTKNKGRKIYNGKQNKRTRKRK